VLNISIGYFCPKVKSPSPGTFRLPNVLAAQRWESPRRVFLYLYTISDQDGFFELDASKISAQTGLSRKTVYKSIALLQKVRLLFLHEARTGRGKHSVYRLNWRKPAKKRDSIEQKKCHPPIRYSMKLNNIHPSGDGQRAIPGEIISPANRRQWNRCMKAFRETLGNSRLPKNCLRICTSVVGRHVKGKTRTYALKLFEKLREWVPKLKLPDWVKSVRDLCCWFMGLLKNIFKPKPKRRRFQDYNEYLWHLHEQEVELVMLKRAQSQQREPTIAELWREWADKQKAELAWTRKQAELARQQLRSLLQACG
jgi:hypothetical protein